MDLKHTEKLLNDVLENITDDKLREKYLLQLVKGMDVEPLPVDIISLVIKGISIDQGINFFDRIDRTNKKNSQEIWKSVKQNEIFKRSGDLNVFEFLCAAFANSCIGGNNCKSLSGSFVTFLTSKSKLKPTDTNYLKGYDNALMSYFLEELPEDIEMPTWDSIKISTETADLFIKLLRDFLDTDTVKNSSISVRLLHTLKKWIDEGEVYNWNRIATRQWENNRLEKHANELEQLVEHYKTTEEELDKLYLSNTKLQFEIKQLRERLDNYTTDISSLKGTVKQQALEIASKDEKIKQYKYDLEESRNLNASFDTFKEDSETALLQDIANALKNEYEDFADSVKDPMDDMLGEIYREKLKSIFKILERKGIKVGD